MRKMEPDFLNILLKNENLLRLLRSTPETCVLRQNGLSQNETLLFQAELIHDLGDRRRRGSDEPVGARRMV